MEPSSSSSSKSGESLQPSINKLLTSKKLADLSLSYFQKNNQKVVFGQLTDPIYECFSKMMSLKIHTLPIFDPSQKQFVGLLDISDFAPYLLLTYGGKYYPFVGWNCRDLTSLVEYRPFRYINCNETVHDALVKYSWEKIHSIPICKDEKKSEMCGMASQSGFIQWLVDSDPKALGPEFNLPLRHFNIGSDKEKRLISVQSDVPLLQVLDTLVHEKVGACAVLDAQGHLIGNISASDLDLVKEEENLKYLNHPVHTYLSAFGLAQPVTCTENDALLEVMKKICSMRIHRVYCMTEERTLQDVITLRDLLHLVVQIANNDFNRND
jgi:CBS domain-containing protein